MSETAEILRKAQTLIEGGWCQGSDATDASGEATELMGRDAARFCAEGALERASVGWSDSEWSVANDRLSEAMSCPGPVFAFNDRNSTKKSDVLALFDRAIAAAEKSDA